MVYMIGKLMSFGGWIRLRKRWVCVVMFNLCILDCGYDGWCSCDFCNGN